MTNKNLVVDFINAYNSLDVEAMLQCLHPEVKFKNISGGEVNTAIEGIKQFEELARESLSLFSQREQKITSYSEEAEKINIEIEYNAVFANDLPNGMKAGDKLQLTGKSEYIIKDGLIYSIIDES
jgi:hypothetical protein